MAAVTGLTAARMLAIEAESIVSGLVDVNGHLILYKHDGSNIDGGLVKGPQGNPGTNGTNGTNGTTLALDAFLVTTPATSYALGVTTFLASPAAGWPSFGAVGSYGNIETVRPYASGAGGTIQYWSTYQAGDSNIYYRQWNYLAVAWTAWQVVGDPPGAVEMFAGATIPAGWLLCDGTAVSRTGQPALYAAIGTTWGVGDGSTTFNLPNFAGRFPVGVDASDATMNALGKTGGSKNHNHWTAYSNDGASFYNGASANVPRTRTKTSNRGTVASTAATGAAREDSTYDEPFSPPFNALNFIIKT